MSTHVVGAPAPVRSRSPWVRLLATVVGCVLLAAVLLAGKAALTSYRNRAPYGPAAVNPRASVTVVTAQQAGPLLASLAPQGKLTPVFPGGTDTGSGKVRNNVVGRLTFSVPAKAAHVSGYYDFFLIDKSSNRSVPNLYGYTAGETVTPGWDSAYNQIGARYPGLSGVGSWNPKDLFGSPGMSIGFGPDGTGSVVFAGAVPEALPATGRLSDQVSAVLAFFGENGHLYWATVVPVTQLR